LFKRKIVAVDLIRLCTIRPRMFFRPEEYGFPSEGINNTGFTQLGEVHKWIKNERICSSLQDLIPEFRVHFKNKRLMGLCALRSDDHR